MSATLCTFLLDTGFTFLTPTEARDLAAQSNADLQDDWTYEAVNDPDASRQKNSRVAVFDAENNFLGNL